MNKEQLVQETKSKLTAATEHFKQEIGKIRTGRAHPGMLDGIMVEAYGQPMPLKAVASVTAPEAQLLQITPFDANNVKAISEAISKDESLGLNPADDGRIVRIQIPPLTEETRQQMVKVLHQKLEESAIAARGARHEALRQAEQAEKDKQIGKDELFHLEKQIDELLARQKTETEDITKNKEKEILTV
ncbi:MAG TPA: ribosome recycling factor [Candidatus Saccharimonadales bacterium]|nr:ribosome recycling factor [Candidatus Saccharimonadales bacterium]